MWKLKSRLIGGEGEIDGRRARDETRRADGEEEKRGGGRGRKRRLQFRFLVVNPFFNLFVRKLNRRRLENWREAERYRVGANRDDPPASIPTGSRAQTEEEETFRSDSPPSGDLRKQRWGDRCRMGFDGMGRNVKRIGIDSVYKDSAVVADVGRGTRTEAGRISALELEYTVDPCRDIVSATESWDLRYQAFRRQVATDLPKQRSIADDLFRLRQGRRDVFKKLQEFGYIDGKASVDDVFIVRGFDRLCRDVSEWRRQAIDALRLRHKQMDDAAAEEEKEDDDADAAAAEAEQQVRHLVAARSYIDSYKTRISQLLCARDEEIRLLRQQLEAAQSLSFAVKVNSRPPVQPESVFTNRRKGVASQVFRGCFSSDVTFWAQRTAVFPDKIREFMLEKKGTAKGDVDGKRGSHLREHPHVESAGGEEEMNRQPDLEKVYEQEYAGLGAIW